MAGQTITNLGTGGSVLDAQSGSTTGADSNDPKWLDWTGQSYVYLPGLTGNYISAPDEAALDITGDIDLRAYVAMDDWTPSADKTFVSKWLDTGNQRSYMLQLLTTGALKLWWSTTGADFPAATSTATLSTTDGSALWVRGTLDVNNGAGGNDVKFYTSTDGSTWSQLGATVTTASTTSIFGGTALLNVGAHGAGTLATGAGAFHRAQVLNGIGGSTVLDVDTSVITAGSATSFTATTGQTVTINRSTTGRKAVAVTTPCWLLGTDDYLTVADNGLLDVGAADNFSVVVVSRQPAYTASQVLASKKSTTGVSAGYLLRNGAGTPASAVATWADGVASLSPAQSGTRSNGAVSVMVSVRDVAADRITTYESATAGTPGTDSTTTTLANTDTFDVGRLSSGSGYADMELLAVAVFRRVLTATEVTALTSYYQARWL